MNDYLFNPRLTVEQMEKYLGLPPKDPRIKRLDRTSPSYQDGMQALADSPGVPVEDLKQMMETVGFNLDLLPE